MQPYAEHEEHHADSGELPGELGIGDEARREGAGQDARDEIADERGQPQLDRTKAHHQRERKRGREGGDEFDAVGHGLLGARS